MLGDLGVFDFRLWVCFWFVVYVLSLLLLGGRFCGWFWFAVVLLILWVLVLEFGGLLFARFDVVVI